MQFMSRLNVFGLIGRRFQYKGVADRWKRRRSYTFTQGKFFALTTVNSYIEYGSCKCTTIRSTLGMRLWLYYEKKSSGILQKFFLDFWYYSLFFNNNKVMFAERFVRNNY
jgi:hypothetical protein